MQDNDGVRKCLMKNSGVFRFFNLLKIVDSLPPVVLPEFLSHNFNILFFFFTIIFCVIL